LLNGFGAVEAGGSRDGNMGWDGSRMECSRVRPKDPVGGVGRSSKRLRKSTGGKAEHLRIRLRSGNNGVT